MSAPKAATVDDRDRVECGVGRRRQLAAERDRRGRAGAPVRGCQHVGVGVREVGRRVRSDGEYGHVGPPDDALGGAPEEQAAQPRPPVGRHNDEVNVLFGGVLGDDPVRLAAFDARHDRRVGLGRTGRGVAHESLAVASAALARRSVTFVPLVAQVRASLGLWRGDVQQVEGRVVGGGHIDDVVEDGVRAVAPVGRKEESVEHGSMLSANSQKRRGWSP